MTGASHTCVCGATLRYRQDLEKTPGGTVTSWQCGDCGTQVPQLQAEKIKHQHPS